MRQGCSLIVEMDNALRIVTRLPLQELWWPDGFATTKRIRALGDYDIKLLLRSGPVQFVTLDVGRSPLWTPLGDSHEYWKREVKPHLAEVESRAPLSQYPNDYCYLASHWDSRDPGVIVVVLEKHH